MKKLDSYHVMIVSKYFRYFQDFVSLESVCKKFQGTMSKFHFNPIPLNTRTIKYFPSIETLNLWHQNEESFGNSVVPSTCDTSYRIEQKKEFFRVVFWYNVSYSITQKFKTSNYVFKCVILDIFNKKSLTEQLSKLEPLPKITALNGVPNEEKPISIPKQITYLGDSIFIYNTMASINLPPYLRELGSKAFYKCENLLSITLPDTLTILRKFCFCDCKVLSEVVLPKYLKMLDNDCFYMCFKLKQITLPDTIRFIGNYCFIGCTSMTSVNIPKGIKVLPNFCFRGCSSLHDIKIPTNVVAIKENCFSLCGLYTIEIPESVQQVGDNAFSGCSHLSEVFFKSSIKTITRHSSISTDKLVQLTSIQGVSSIGKECFAKCSELSVVNLPNTNVTLGKNCFSCCPKLSSITYQQDTEVNATSTI
ncbi:hypothetical protein EIN_061220 [Entamoeba invadens IP1]|uniref:hypothetical protein n=1 Tax=Entamoeba invadens IP1 TaxID=370355 RepID=UPI0002C3D183|nr:hypothetical protein EIN_061220 [Entamoeba invadens IP1]ELP93557.1 hypothetical protein EIN_061220 [Entamoeba invadens IP1]|eukprot:XP_004260328.1 hypothetical protein EIN_061220 [Entamoeba invadens IP1]